MSYKTLRFEVSNGIATITLDRPEAMNAMSPEMMTELSDVAIQCDESTEIRAVLLTGGGKAFCAGGDLASFAASGDGVGALLKAATVDLHAALSRFARMRAPLVTSINGTAAGAGLSLAVAGDLAISAESAKFTMAYTNAGLVPDGSSTFTLPRLIGLRRTQELALTNRVLDAATALDWGLVTRVVADAELESESKALAEKLASGPTAAYGATKNLLLASSGDSLEAQMEREARAISAASTSADGREGIAAFLEKRKPKFQGR